MPPAAETTEQPPVALSPGRRVVDGLRERANWHQLVRFGLVGGSGYVINLAVFAGANRFAPYVVASLLAFCTAVGNNFVWNRRWTFRSTLRSAPVHHQAARFLAVSSTAWVVSLGLLTFLVEVAGVNEFVAQLFAVTLVMPISFLGNRLWSFR